MQENQVLLGFQYAVEITRKPNVYNVHLTLEDHTEMVVSTKRNEVL